MGKKILIGMGVVLAVLLVLALVRMALVQPRPDKGFFTQVDGERPLVIAHQGGERVWPSNTMFAYQNAVDLGVDVLEMDVHQTADGVLVLIHDDTVDRTTDGSGAVSEMTLAEVQALDAGYYWTDDDGQSYPFRGQGITIPTLEEVFTTFPQTPMVIEVKQQEPAIVRPFCQMLRDYDMADKVLMGTFHEAVMTDFRATCPEVATSLVQSEITPFWALNQIGLGGLVQLPGEALQVPLTAELPVLGEVDVVTERFVAAAADQNVDVQPWTIDDPEEMARLLDLGVQGIITDRPDVMVALLAERP